MTSQPVDLAEIDAWIESQDPTIMSVFKLLQAPTGATDRQAGGASWLMMLIFDAMEEREESNVPASLREALYIGGKRRPHKPPDKLVAIAREATSLGEFIMNACTKHQQIVSDSIRFTQLAIAFDRKFYGTAPKDLETAIGTYSEIYNESKHYGRCISIVQSSATGKSRLIKEFSKTNPTITICFRALKGPRAGYPPGDPAPYEYFRQTETPESERFMGEELAAAFFGSLFKEMAKSINDAITENPTANPVDQIATWKDPSSRERHFKTVVDDARSRLNGLRSWLSEKNSWFTSRCGESDTKPPAIRLPTPECSIEGWCDNLFRKFCLEDCNNLRTLVNDQPVYVAIDECLGLGEWRYGDLPARYMTVLALQRMIKHCESFKNFWVFLLDTTLSVPRLLPYGPNAKSMRLTRDYSMLPPFVHVGFNVVANQTLDPLETAADALKLSRLKKYGRPYWSTLPDEQVIGAAQQKLFFDPSYGTFHGEPFQVTNTNHVFAAFANTVILEIGHSEQSTMLAVDAVSSHLRILLGIVNGVLVTQAPSEPILALVSLQALQNNAESALDVFLKELLLKGLVIERGQKGELFCRVLCILSRAIATPQLFLKESVVPVSRAVWLRTLLNLEKDQVDDVDHSLTALLNSNEPVFINFTHVVQMSISLADISNDSLVKAWEGHYMIQCTIEEPFIDGLWPEYRGDLHKPFDPNNMAYGIYRSKIADNSSSSNVADELTGPYITRICRDGTTERFKPEHIALLIELGLHTQTQSTQSTSIHLTHRPAKSPTFFKLLPHLQASARKRFYADPAKNETEPKRYCFVIRGYSEAQYPVLKDFGHAMETLVGFTIPSIFPDLDEKFRQQMDPNLIGVNNLDSIETQDVVMAGPDSSAMMQ